MKKILWINYLPGGYVGPVERLNNIAQALEVLNVNIQPILFAHSLKQKLHPSIQLISMSTKQRYLGRGQKYKYIQSKIANLTYDGIILRYPFVDSSSVFFVENNNVVSEHHTLETQEIDAHLAINSGINAMVLKRQKLRESNYQQKYLDKVKAVVGVTEEITQAHPHNTKYTLSNGIFINSNELNNCSTRIADNATFEIIMLATVHHAWIGFDRLVSSVKNYKGNLKLRIRVFGANKSEDLDVNGHEIKVRGFISGDVLKQELHKSNIAIGPLGLFKKGMQDACALKNREYCTNGIPFLLANNDPDFSGELSFVYPVTNDDSLIDFDQIYEWARALPTDVSEQMKEYAKKHLDWNVKLKKFAEFIYRVFD